MANQDREALLTFLDFASNRGLMKKTTAQSLKSACSAVLGILDENDAKDVFAVDLEGMFQRYENLKESEVSPSTFRAYRQRVKQAVAEFQRYKANPSNWKPAGAQRTANRPKRASKNTTNTQAETNATHQTPDLIEQPSSADQITYHFPLRENVFVRITGIPFDVTRPEMGRMTAFLSNLVPAQEGSEPVHLMLNSPDAEAV